MTIEYGLLPTGFVPKTFTIIRADIEAAVRAALGLNLPLGDTTLLGILIAIMSERYAELWALSQAVFQSQDPDSATGTALRALGAITGTFDFLPASSTVVLTLTGDPGATVPAVSEAQSVSSGALWQTIADATLVALTAFVPSGTYAVGDRTTSAGACYVVSAITTGIAGTGLFGTDDAIVSGGVTFRFIGSGTAAADTDAISVDVGPIVGAFNDITIRATPVAGWLGVRNLANATPGRLPMTDEEFRLVREAEIASDGSSTQEALKADLLQIVGVLSATVFVNNTDFVDADGRPPHSVQALVRTSWAPSPTDDQVIWDLLFANVAAGIVTFGSTIGTVVDTEGVSHTLAFDRPTEVPIYIDITLTYDAANYPTDGDAQVKAAIVAFGAAFSTGRDAVAVGLGAQAFKVAGVLDVPRSGSLGGTLISTAPSPTVDTTISIDLLHLATFDASRITVHSTPATP